MPTNPAPRKQNDRHIADQAVTLPTKTSIPVCTFDDVFNRRFNDGQQPPQRRTTTRPPISLRRQPRTASRMKSLQKSHTHLIRAVEVDPRGQGGDCGMFAVAQAVSVGGPRLARTYVGLGGGKWL